VKLREIFRFEFVYQARSVRTWLYFAVLFAAAFLLMRTAGAGDGVINTPYAIAQQTVLTCGLWILMAPAVAGSAAARDAQSRMHPLIDTAPIGKGDYLGGRFLAALSLNALILLAVPLGILTALYLPGLERATVGPLRPAAYLCSYGLLALPTAFTFTAVQFSSAALKRRTSVSYLASVLFFAAAGIAAGLALNVLRMPALGQLLDPTCRMTVLVVMADTWTPLEKNTVPIGPQGLVLANRLLWFGLATALLAFTCFRFRFGHRAG
jgi:hypothetical protein